MWQRMLDLRTMADKLRQRVNVRSLEEALQSFRASSDAFRIIRSQEANKDASAKPRTLFVLDSSYNPPTRAHLTLATSALGAGQDQATFPKPHRLLLLFSTNNADKSVKPEIFIDRLAMMSLFAEDVVSSLKTTHPQLADQVRVDVGLTTTPYFMDKSSAIAASNQYPEASHVHIVGYDTLIRIVAPKYYPNHTPPLSALAPYFEAGHRFLIKQRPYDEADESSKLFGTEEEQVRFLENLRQGEREELGFKREWGHQIQMLPPGEAKGVSSTRVRRTVKEGDWDEAAKLTTPSVLEWVQAHRLYQSST